MAKQTMFLVELEVFWHREQRISTEPLSSLAEDVEESGEDMVWCVVW
jgi:hypothetical protein